MILDQTKKERLEQLLKSPQANVLIEYLELVKEDLNNIQTIESWEETLGRKKALKIIDDLFDFKNNQKIEIKNKNQYI